MTSNLNIASVRYDLCISFLNDPGIGDRKNGGRETPLSRIGSTRWSVWRISSTSMPLFVWKILKASDDISYTAAILYVCLKNMRIRMIVRIGLRAPFLRVGWNRQFLMMSEFGFVYDSSILAPFSNLPVWPYTLDHRPPHDCVESEQLCPTRAYPGLWELPLNQLLAGVCNPPVCCI